MSCLYAPVVTGNDENGQDVVDPNVPHTPIWHMLVVHVLLWAGELAWGEALSWKTSLAISETHYLA